MGELKICERSVLSVQDGRVTREQSPSMDIDVQEEEAEGKKLLFHCLLRRPCTLKILFVLVNMYFLSVINSPCLNSSDDVVFPAHMYRGAFPDQL